MPYSENNTWQLRSHSGSGFVFRCRALAWLAPPRSCPEEPPPPAAMHHSNQGLGDVACTLYLSIINKRTNNTESMGQPAQILGVIEQLKNPIDEQHLVQALRRLKNDIIGHSEEKEAYLDSGIVPVLLQLLNDEKPAIESKVQVSQILCSFAHGPEQCVDKLLTFPLIPSTLKTLTSTESTQLINTCLKIMVTILQTKQIPDIITDMDSLVSVLLYILSHQSSPLNIVEQCCRLIPLISTSKHCQESIQQLSVRLTPRILSFIKDYKAGMGSLSLELAIAALAHVMSPQQARNILSSKDSSSDEFLHGLVLLTRDPNANLRLSAVELLAKLQKHAIDDEQKSKMLQPVLPTLVPIMDMMNDDPRVSLTLANICRDDKQSATRAVEVHVVQQLTTTLKSLDFEDYKKSELISNNMLALAGIGLHEDEFRKLIIEKGGLQLITKAMALSPNSNTLPSASLKKVKVSACNLLRSLSRSVALLRTSLDSKDVADSIVDLLQTGESNNQQEMDDDMEVKSAVMAATCNLILEFSPLRDPLLNRGILDLIVSGTHAVDHDALRLNSVWAIKHVVFQVPADSKLTVLNKLTSEYLFQLCNDPDILVQEQAMNALRNFMCGGEEVIDRIIGDIGTEPLFDMIESKIEPNSIYYQCPEILASTIYTLVHMASGNEHHRDLICKRDGLLSNLIPLLGYSAADVRVSILWLVINLTWVEHQYDGERGASCRSRAKKLIKLGFHDVLDKRSNDSVLDVRERTKMALSQLESLSSMPTASSQDIASSSIISASS